MLFRRGKIMWHRSPHTSGSLKIIFYLEVQQQFGNLWGEGNILLAGIFGECRRKESLLILSSCCDGSFFFFSDFWMAVSVWSHNNRSWRSSDGCVPHQALMTFDVRGKLRQLITTEVKTQPTIQSLNQTHLHFTHV